MAKFGDTNTNDLVDTSNFGGSWDPPACKVSRKTTQVLTVNVPYTVIFDATTGTEDYKTVAGMHSTATNTDRVVATALGLFLVKAQFVLAGAAGGYLISLFIDVVVPSLSQTTTYEVRSNSASAQSRFVKPVLVDVDPNTYVSMRVKSTAGTPGTLALLTWLTFRAVALT